MLVFGSGNMARRCITHNHSGGNSGEDSKNFSFDQRNIFQRKLKLISVREHFYTCTKRKF